MLAYLFVLLAAAARFVFAPLAFAPIAPALLYFAARQPRKRMWIPLVVLIAADIVLSLRVYGYPLTADLVVSWAWYAAVLLLGGALAGKMRPARIAGAALASSVSFFLLSNFATWLVWEMYPRTAAGLLACYVAAIPFFRSQLASDLFFTAVFFSLPVVLESARKALRPSDAATA